MNEPAIRTEEQIISLFPDRETLVCRGWVLKSGNEESTLEVTESLLSVVSYLTSGFGG